MGTQFSATWFMFHSSSCFLMVGQVGYLQSKRCCLTSNKKTISQNLSAENFYNWIILKKCFVLYIFLQKSFFILLQKVFMIVFLSVPTTNVPTENFGEISICRKLCNLAKIYRYYLKSFCEIAINFLKNFRKLFHRKSAENFYNWIILKKSFFIMCVFTAKFVHLFAKGFYDPISFCTN